MTYSALKRRVIHVWKWCVIRRLAQERQQAAEKPDAPKKDEKENLVESLKKAGVENYHMNAAVPGTEIPGHKVFFTLVLH